MKTILPCLFFLLSALNTQANHTHSGNYKATCVTTMNFFAEPTHAYFEEDSLIIDFSLYGQCCPEWDFQISKLTNDTLFLSFADTSEMVCDCDCDFNIRINAGKFENQDIKINLNEKWLVLQPADYKPLLESYKIWNSLQFAPYFENETKTNFEESIDSTWYSPICWNGKSYHKVTTTAITINEDFDTAEVTSKFIREENGKVFYIDTTDNKFSGCNEALLYDFSANANDTLIIGYDSIPYIISPTVALVLSDRRAYSLKDLSDPELSTVATWIEGIGDLRGIFNSTLSLAIEGYTNLLTCCSDKEGFIYQNSSYPDCGKTLVSPPNTLVDIQVFPVPAKNLLQIQGIDIPSEYNYKVIDMNGKILISDKLSNQFYLDLPNGIYILKIIDDSNIIYQNKLIIIN